MCFVFLFSAVSTGILIPEILLISFRKKLFDEPDERKIHTAKVPRLGGIAFAPVIFFSILFLLGVNLILQQFDFLYELKADLTEFIFGCCSILLLYVIGVADDLIGVRYRAKFFVQIFCGMMLVSSGLWINNLQGLFGIYELPLYIGGPLTIFMVVFVINAINLIDGIDGLASGLSGIALLFYGIVCMHYRLHFFALLAFATLGAIVPFFYFNVYGRADKGKKIFMGDTGSLTIGMILCVLGLKLCFYTSAGVTSLNPILLVCAPLLIPCFDVVRVAFHRIRTGKHVFMPDRNHIHHKMMRCGFSPFNTMLLIFFLSIFYISSNVLLSRVLNVNLLLFGDLLTWILLNVAMTAVYNRRKQASIATVPEIVREEVEG